MTTTTKSLFRDDGEPSFVATERLYETADRDELVTEDDPRAAFLFCIPEQRISRRDAERYGLLKPKDEPKQTEPEANKKREPEENK